MTFPALDALAADTDLGHTTWRVYMHLQRSMLDHVNPHEVKVWAVAETLHLSKKSVVAALNWLAKRGYLIEAPRVHTNAVRSFTLAWSVKDHAA